MGGIGLVFFVDKKGIKGSTSSYLILECQGTEIARIMPEVVGDAVPQNILCEIDPSVASALIGEELAEKIQSWIERPIADISFSLCEEIRMTCENIGVDGRTHLAIGLLVYLERNGWERIK